MSIWTSAFWKATTERALASVAGGALSVLGTNAIVPAFETDWRGVVSVALGAGLVSVLKALGANSANGGQGPSAAPKAENVNINLPGAHRAE